MKKIISYLLIIVIICLIILTTLAMVLENEDIPKKKIVNSKKNSIKNSFCGDGVISGNEECDGNSIYCITSNGYSGTKTCTSSCSTYGSCVSTEFCGDGICNGSENISSCLSDCDYNSVPLPKDLDLYKQIEKYIIDSNCSDPSQFEYFESTEGEIKTYHYVPKCYPPYYIKDWSEGYFVESSNQPLPIMGRTCGKFNILVVFFDNPQNRNLIRENQGIPEDIRQKIVEEPFSGLKELFEKEYETNNVFDSQGISPTPNVQFDFEFQIIKNFNNSAELSLDSREYTADFLNYDVVLFLENPGGFAGFGIRKWPIVHPIFDPQQPNVFSLSPNWLSPGLFYNELFRRNLPVILSEYKRGEYRLVKIGDVTYDKTEIYNPRTGADVRENLTMLSLFLSGWGDIDGDGITDCEDEEIKATSENIDADLLPDFLDPDLSRPNNPYFWTSG